MYTKRREGNRQGETAKGEKGKRERRGFSCGFGSTLPSEKIRSKETKNTGGYTYDRTGMITLKVGIEGGGNPERIFLWVNLKKRPKNSQFGGGSRKETSR